MPPGYGPAQTAPELSPVCQGSLAEAVQHGGEAPYPDLGLSRARQRGNHGNPDTSGRQKSNCVSDAKQTEQVKAFHHLSASLEQPKTLELKISFQNLDQSHVYCETPARLGSAVPLCPDSPPWSCHLAAPHFLHWDSIVGKGFPVSPSQTPFWVKKPLKSGCLEKISR